MQTEFGKGMVKPEDAQKACLEGADYWLIHHELLFWFKVPDVMGPDDAGFWGETSLNHCLRLVKHRIEDLERQGDPGYHTKMEFLRLLSFMNFVHWKFTSGS